MSTLTPLASLFAASAVVFFTSTLLLLIWWRIAISWMRPAMMNDKYMDMMVDMQISNFWLLLFRGLPSLFAAGFNAIFTIVGSLFDNALTLGAFAILTSGSLVWMEYHDNILESYMVVRQCYAGPTLNFFLLPVFNILTMLYDTAIAVVNFYVNLQAFYWYGFPIILFKCAINVDVGNTMFYFSDLFKAFFFDLNNWLIAGPLTDEWDIHISLHQFGLFVDTLVPIFTCFCSVIEPLYQAVNLFCNEPSLHDFFNCLLNFIVRILQIVIVTLQYFLAYILPGPNPVKPDFTNITLEACCVFESGGDALEDAVFLIVELLWGILSIPNLPIQVQQLIAVHYFSIVTHPICGIAKIVNMTAVLFLNMNDDPNGFFDPAGTGIQYLQFGFVADEFRYAALRIGELFYVFNPAAQLFTQQIGLCIVDAALFLVEWIPGNVFFFFFSRPSDVLPVYPAPTFSGITQYLNFLFYYFPNYWVKAPPGGIPITLGSYTYSSGLYSLYHDAFALAVGAGNLVALINSPLGCAVEHLLKVIITFVSFLANLISFFITILTFQTDLLTTARAVIVKQFFLEARYTAGCLGNIISQFGDCTVTDNNSQSNLMCCTGDVITAVLDAIILLAEQVVHFFQDMLTLPTNTIELCLFGKYNPSNTQCVRIPNLAGPIYEVNLALCAFSCAVANILPVYILFNSFDCVFVSVDEFPEPDPEGEEPGAEPEDPGIYNPLPLPTCGSVTSCIANVICAILQIVTVPFTILNQFFIQMIMGNPFTNLFDFLNNTTTLFATAVGQAADSLAMLVDCAICAFSGGQQSGGYGCPTVFFTLMHYIFVVPFIGLMGSFGLLSFYTTRIIMNGVKSMNYGYGYWGVMNMLTSLAKSMGISGITANFWFVTFFERLSLHMVGSFFNAVNYGVCETVELTIDLITTELEVFSLGLITIPPIVMCCYEGAFCYPGKKRFSIYTSEEERKKRSALDYDQSDVLNLTQDNWLEFILSNFSSILQWPANDKCTDAMTLYRGTPWSQLPEDSRWHVNFCVYKIIWRIRTDNQSIDQLPNSTCDDAMMGIPDNDWDTLRFMEKSQIYNCILSRKYIDLLRQRGNIPWFPQDWSTNEYRKWHFGWDLIAGARIYYQYMMDRNTAPSIIMTPAYQATWANMGLNIALYKNLQTVDDILIMRTQYSLADYYAMNGNATQYEPMVWFTTGVWKFIEIFAENVEKNSAAFSDPNVTNPLDYMSFEYTAGSNTTSIADGLIYHFISGIATSVKNYAAMWSNPANLKKRANFITDIGKTFSGIARGTEREVNLMTIEWINSVKHNVSMYYGECEVNETRNFMYEYEKTIRGLDHLEGKTSKLYQLSEWWHNFEWPTIHDNGLPRDGVNRTELYTEAAYAQFYQLHRDEATGKMVNETIGQRLSRYVAIIRKGTPEANVRVSKLTAGFRMMRDRFYTEVIQYRLDSLQKASASASMAAASPQRQPPRQATTYQRDEHDRVIYHNLSQQLAEIKDSMIDSYEDVCVHYPDQECLTRKEFKHNGSIFHNLEYVAPRVFVEDDVVIEMKRLNKSMEDIVKHYSTSDASDLYRPHKQSSYSIAAELLDPKFTSQMLIRMDGLITLTCASNITFLCTECFYLDQLVGRVINAVRIAVTYYEGGQYGNYLNQTMEFTFYLFNPNANARLGDSQELPARWPWAQFDNLRVIGDNTPNKLRFHDIEAITANISSDLDTSFANSTLMTNPIDYGTMNGVVLGLFRSLFAPVMDFFYNLITFVFSPVGVTDAQASISFIIENWLVCDWNVGSAYLGTNKRFSIGEMMFAYLVVFFVVMFLSIFIFRVNVWTIITGTSISLFVFLFTFLNLTYNWAWTCYPGLPVQFMGDINYFFINTLFSRCDWYFSGLVLNEYTNSNCASCAYAMDITMANCMDYGFVDISANIVFTLQYFLPGVLQWLRDTTTPIYIFYQIPFINERINAFASLNMNDPQIYALYWNCNAITTLVPNMLIGGTFLLFVRVLTPAFTFAIVAALFIIETFISLLFIIYFILESFFVMTQIIPSFMTGNTETTFAGSDGTTDGPQGNGSYSNQGATDMNNMSLTGNIVAQEMLAHMPAPAKTRRLMPRKRLATNNSAIGRPKVHNPLEFEERDTTLTYSRLKNVFDRARLRVVGDRKTK